MLDQKKSHRLVVPGEIYEFANKLDGMDRAISAELYMLAANTYRKGLGALSTQEVTALKRAVLKAGSLFRELAVASAAAGDKAAAAGYWLKASESYKQSIAPLVEWQVDARDQGAARAGSLYRELATESTRTGAKAAAAEYWLKASDCFKQSISPLADWQVEVRDNAPAKAGSLNRELAVEAAKIGIKAAAADYWLKASECFKQSISPLAEWQVEARDQGPARAGSLYRELAGESAKIGAKAAVAEHWLKASECFKQSISPLVEWQVEARDQGPARAGRLYRELADESAKAGDKAKAAGYWLKAFESFTQSPVPLADWQIEARDKGPARAGSLYREMAVATAKIGDKPSAAEYWLKAAASFKQSTLPLAGWQEEIRDQGTAKAGNLYRELALAAANAGDKAKAAEFWLRAARISG